MSTTVPSFGLAASALLDSADAPELVADLPDAAAGLRRWPPLPADVAAAAADVTDTTDAPPPARGDRRVRPRGPYLTLLLWQMRAAPDAADDDVLAGPLDRAPGLLWSMTGVDLLAGSLAAVGLLTARHAAYLDRDQPADDDDRRRSAPPSPATLAVAALTHAPGAPNTRPAPIPRGRPLVPALT